MQQYPDLDASGGVRDYACQHASYDGHKGVDIRLSSIAEINRTYEVVAAAGGRVKAVRDGMADRSVRNSQSRSGLRGRECGNGLVIEHRNGWETQYCHLKHGSLRVRPGERVVRGQALGAIGASGLAQFAHLHFGVRRWGVTYSPFLGRPLEAGCSTEAQQFEMGIWDRRAYDVLKIRGPKIIAAGFADGPVSSEITELGGLQSPDATSPALVLFGRVINIEAGDRLRLRVSGPQPFKVDNTTKGLARRKAHYVAFVGRRLRGVRWPAGRYTGTIEVIRDKAILSASTSILNIE